VGGEGAYGRLGLLGVGSTRCKQTWEFYSIYFHFWIKRFLFLFIYLFFEYHLVLDQTQGSGAMFA
jgi:hypothetical protein